MFVRKNQICKTFLTTTYKRLEINNQQTYLCHVLSTPLINVINQQTIKRCVTFTFIKTRKTIKITHHWHNNIILFDSIYTNIDKISWNKRKGVSSTIRTEQNTKYHRKIINNFIRSCNKLMRYKLYVSF